MGNAEVSLNTQLELVRIEERPHLGTVQLMRHGDQQCLSKAYSYSDQFLMEDRFRRLKARCQRPSSHSLSIFQLQRKEIKEICANNYQLVVYMERPPQSLRSVLQERVQAKKNYSEQQLLLFLSRTAEALLYLQDNGLHNIQLDAEALLLAQDHVKVVDRALGSSTSYAALLHCLEQGLRPQEDVYLAPQLLKECLALNTEPYISPKADVFSLGMLAMEMVGLESMREYYDYPKGQLDYDSLIHRLSRITHSLPFKTLLAEMLEYEPEERIGILSLREKLKKLCSSEAGMTRSRSSKMLQDILSHSRRSSSISHQSQRSSSLSRQPSSEQKGRPIEQIKGKEQRVPFGPHSDNVPALSVEHNNPSLLKNLVKNKLSKNRDSQNPKKDTADQNNTQQLPAYNPLAPTYNRPALTSNRQPTHLRSHRQVPEAKQFLQSRGFMDHNSLEGSVSSKLGTGEGHCAVGVRSTLSKLVEQSGMKRLLRLEQLDVVSQKDHDTGKNTSRFGSYEANPLPEPNITALAFSEEQGVQGQPVRTLQKVMTFNREVLLNARSVQNSVETYSRGLQKSSKLSLSPIPGPSILSQEGSQPRTVTIRDVPVVVSQEKTLEEFSNKKYSFGQLQRQLSLMDYAESVHAPSLANSVTNVSKVIESYQPRTADYCSSEAEPSEAFRKKGWQGEGEPQSLPLSMEPLQNKAESYKTNLSSERLSNFTSMSKESRTKGYSLARGDSKGNLVSTPEGDYEGEMLGDLPHGNGVLYRQGKLLFSGSFKFGKYSGYGTLYNPNYCRQNVDFRHIDPNANYWDRFEGEFENGLMNGFGTLFFGEGEKFSGCLKAGVIEGYGCFYSLSGELTSGLWSSNRYRKV